MILSRESKSIAPGLGMASHKVWKLVHYEATGDITGAIEREKQLKAGSRQAKVALIEALNPKWRDLYHDLVVAT